MKFAFSLTILILSACGLTSKYKNPQHSIYADMLTLQEKSVVNKDGQLIKQIEIKNPNNDRYHLLGTLKILKTENPEVFNFVEIGQWINHTTTTGEVVVSHRLVRDTTLNDELGNTLSRVVYYGDKIEKEFSLVERWKAKFENGLFIQHIENFHNGILTFEYDKKVIDYNTPKSDTQKRKIYTGTFKEYSADGKLRSVKTFDENGNVTKVEEYGR